MCAGEGELMVHPTTGIRKDWHHVVTKYVVIRLDLIG